ncbi:MAG: class I SAM-dependent methyltransferase [Chloroflexota bacterium]|nr:class I SAM-dependent methyltransferase [Chloroflexota bacterium]MDE2897558.1 class I SAM-dependent methyltransferase [Chloroflexota bacterium]
MIPATDPEADYHALVRRGYDACAGAYHEARKTQAPTELRELMDRLEAAAEVLDLGCGAGVPIARSLAARHRVTGVDISREMVSLARRNVPTGDFICADVASIDLDPASFDAVVAICSIFHLPRAEQPALFRKVHRWLRPGGYFLCTLSHHSEAGYTEDGFFGVTMYWSNYALGEYVETLADLGFEVLETSSTARGYDETTDGTTEDHPLVLARKR